MTTISFIISKGMLENNVIRLDDTYLIYNKFKRKWNSLSKEKFEEEYETDNLLETPFSFNQYEFIMLLEAITSVMEQQILPTQEKPAEEKIKLWKKIKMRFTGEYKR